MDSDPNGSSPAVTLRPADPSEAPLLSDLAFRSKAQRGYTEAFMRACRTELTYSAEQIGKTDLSFVVAESEGAVIGFYALERVRLDAFELEALFVAPGHTGQGVGRALLDHATRSARAGGGRTLTIQSDPFALDFYREAGAVVTGERPSGSIPGRMLPVLTISLT